MSTKLINFARIAKRYFSDVPSVATETPSNETDVVTLDTLLLKACEDPDTATNLILVGLASAGFVGGGIELLAATEIQRRLNKTAAALEKQVGPLKSILRQAIRAGVSTVGSLAGFFAGSYEMLGQLLQSPSAVSQAVATVNTPGNIFKLAQVPASWAKTAALEATGRLATAPVIGATLPTDKALPNWVTNIPKALKRAKHFSNVNTPDSRKTSDVVFSKLIGGSESDGFLFKALLAGLAALGVGTASLGTYKLSSVISRAKAVSKELQSRHSFLSTIKSGLMSLWQGPIVNEVMHQVSTRQLAAVARGKLKAEALGSPVHIVSNVLS